MAKKMTGEERREQAAEAALKLAQKGLSAVTVTGVAKEMGVVPSALYRHFKSKEDLMFAVLAHMRKLIDGNVGMAMQAASDPVDALHRLSRMQAETLCSHPGLIRLMFSEEITRPDDGFREGVENTSGHFRALVRMIIEKGQVCGMIRSDIPSHDIMFAFLGTLLPPMFISHITAGQFNFAEQIRRNWRLFEETIRPRET